MGSAYIYKRVIAFFSKIEYIIIGFFPQPIYDCLIPLNFNPDDNVVPKIKCLEKEEPMASYEWLNKNALEFMFILRKVSLSQMEVVKA